MRFPTDESAAARQFLSARDARALSIESERLAAASEAHSRLLISPQAVAELAADRNPFERALFELATKEGLVAGEILAVLAIMIHFSEETAEFREPSLAKAIKITSLTNREVGFGDNSRAHTAESALRDIWRRYKPVAHLWAALHLNQPQSPLWSGVIS